VEAVDRVAEVAALGDNCANLHAGSGTNVVDGEHVARVDHGDHEVVASDADRKNFVTAAHRGRHESDCGAVYRVLEQLDIREARLCGASGCELRLRDNTLVEESQNRLVVFLTFARDRVQFFDRNYPPQNEDLGQRRHAVSPPDEKVFPAQTCQIAKVTAAWRRHHTHDRG
jgi:hypothetical protein